MMKLVLGTAAGALLFAGPALAADLNAEPIPEAPIATPMSSAFDWTGAYVGADVGYGFAQRSENGLKSNGKGFSGGAFGGYNYQIDPHWVIGGEADISSGAADSATSWLGTVRARGGYAINNLLLYATGGPALAEGKVKVGGGTDSQTHFGYAVGAGVEAALTKNIVARAEYLYVDTNHQNYKGTSTVSTDLDGSTVRVGVGYKF